MTIPSITNKPQVAIPTKTKAAETVSTAAKTTEPETDKVDITEIAKRITTAFESSTDTQVINQKRVDEVRSALNNGTYEINAENIAKQMIQIERENDLFNSR